MENIVSDIKVRLRKKAEKGDKSERPWSYALTISEQGCIMSSTTNSERAAMFSAELVDKVSVNREKFHKKMEVESF